MMRNVILFIVIAIFLTISASLPLMKDAYAHASSSVIVNPHSYSMQPGQTLTQDMRVCLLTGGNFTVSNVTFNGNYSNWAKADADFPVEGIGPVNVASSIDIPLTVTVPTNFTENHALIQAVVEVQSVSGATQATAGIPVFIRESTSTPQDLADCNFFRNVQSGISVGIIVLISGGGALVALGYFVYRHSKESSTENKASLGAKLFSMLLVLMGSLLMLIGLFLLVAQRIL